MEREAYLLCLGNGWVAMGKSKRETSSCNSFLKGQCPRCTRGVTATSRRSDADVMENTEMKAKR